MRLAVLVFPLIFEADRELVFDIAHALEDLVRRSCRRPSRRSPPGRACRCCRCRSGSSTCRRGRSNPGTPARPVAGSIRHSQPWPTMRQGSSGLIAPPRAPYAVDPKNSRTNFPVLASHVLTRFGEASASVTQSVPAVHGDAGDERHALLLPGADQAASAGSAYGAEQTCPSGSKTLTWFSGSPTPT